MIGAVARAFAEFVFPGFCAACGDPSEDNGRLCAGCAAQVARLAASPCCRLCAMPLAYAGAPCPFCKGKGPPLFERVVRWTPFDGPVKQLVHRMKYHRDWALAEHLADRLLAVEWAKELLHETEVLVPVPLHGLRQMSRGYNQAEVIARRIGKACGIRVAGAAIRIRHTETQTALHSPTRRERNLRDAFGLVDPRAVCGKHVVLVDDVMTTGATLRSLARALRPAGPASVSALVLAVADPKRKGFERTDGARSGGAGAGSAG